MKDGDRYFWFGFILGLCFGIIIMTAVVEIFLL
jgi:hypothetical protein